VRSYGARVVRLGRARVNTRVPYRATTPGGLSIIEAFKIPLNSLRAVRLFAALSSSNAKPVFSFAPAGEGQYFGTPHGTLDHAS
jgi:hypothetical protein